MVLLHFAGYTQFFDRIHSVAGYTRVYPAKLVFSKLSVSSGSFPAGYTQFWPDTLSFDRIHSVLAGDTASECIQRALKWPAGYTQVQQNIKFL